MTLSSEQKSIIAQGKWLNDLHMDHFNDFLKTYSDYRPVETWRIQLMNTIQSIPKNKRHIQIYTDIYRYYSYWDTIGCVVITIQKIYLFMILKYKNIKRVSETVFREIIPNV